MSNTSTPPTAYVVTGGAYSDYHVVAVFTDKELAEAFVEAEGGDDILEEPLRTAMPGSVTVYVMKCNVPDEDSFRIGPWWVDDSWSYRVWDLGSEWAAVPGAVENDDKAGKSFGKPQHRYRWDVVVKGTDQERVRKVYGDTKARVRAEIEGLT